MLWFRRSTHPDEVDLSAFIDEELTQSRRVQVEAHLEACDSCRRTLEELRAMQSLVSRLPQAQPSRSFVLTAEMAGTVQPERPAPRRSALAVAPAVALTLLVALLAVDLGTTTDSGGNSTAQRDAGAISLAANAGNAEVAPSLATEPEVQSDASADDGSDKQARETTAVDAAGGAGGEAEPEVTAAYSAPGTPQTLEEAESAAAAAEAPAALPSEAEAGAGDEDNGLDWLRVLEVVAAIAFFGSLVLVIRPGFLRKGN